MSFVQPSKMSFNISYAALNGSTPGGLSIVYEVVFRGWNDTELEGDRSSQLKALTIAEGDQTEGWIEIFLESVIFKTHYSCVRSFVYEACWLNLIFISWSLKKMQRKLYFLGLVEFFSSDMSCCCESMIFYQVKNDGLNQLIKYYY